MDVIEFLANLCGLISIGFAAISAKYWWRASSVRMPVNQDLPADLPGQGRVVIHGEDYAITFARLNEGIARLDESLEAINLSSKFNATGSKFAMLTALSLALGLVFTLLSKVLAAYGSPSIQSCC